MAELIVVTKRGTVKRTDLSEYHPHHRGTEGVIGVRLRKGDEVVGAVRVERASQSIFVITNRGTTLRFKVSEIPKMGRRTQGVIALRLRRGEHVATVVGV